VSDLTQAIEQARVEGRLPCAGAFAVALRLGLEPRRVGEEATRRGIKISLCQLGLFGHAAEGKGRIVRSADAVARDLEDAIRSRLAERKLPCRTAWDAAELLSLSRLEVANAAESLGIRISACQLGCFD